MNKKGFTLIELLAVIIILAVIALIAVPTILNIIDSSKKNALENTAYGMISAGELYYGNYLISNKSLSGTTTFSAPTFNGLEIKGEKPKCGQVNVYEDGKISLAICNEQYGIVKNKTSEQLVITEFKGEITKESWIANLGEDFDKENGLLKYKNVTMIYFNPEIGKSCNDYVVNNSLNQNKSGCMKWYIFNDETSKSTVDMILDHNTTHSILWNSGNNNVDGPKEILNQLKSDTSSWVGVPTRSDSYVDRARGYTINYKDNKARLIDVNEIAKIVGADKDLQWDSGKDYGTNVGTQSSTFYLDGSGTEYTGWRTQVANSTNKSKYAWLYDYTNSCISYGCNIEDNNTTVWYWTASASSYNTSGAWSVRNRGNLSLSAVNSSGALRPVITIPKSQL